MFRNADAPITRIKSANTLLFCPCFTTIKWYRKRQYSTILKEAFLDRSVMNQKGMKENILKMLYELPFSLIYIFNPLNNIFHYYDCCMYNALFSYICDASFSNLFSYF